MLGCCCGCCWWYDWLAYAGHTLGVVVVVAMLYTRTPAPYTVLGCLRLGVGYGVGCRWFAGGSLVVRWWFAGGSAATRAVTGMLI